MRSIWNLVDCAVHLCIIYLLRINTRSKYLCQELWAMFDFVNLSLLFVIHFCQAYMSSLNGPSQFFIFYSWQNTLVQRACTGQFALCSAQRLDNESLQSVFVLQGISLHLPRWKISPVIQNVPASLEVCLCLCVCVCVCVCLCVCVLWWLQQKFWRARKATGAERLEREWYGRFTIHNCCPGSCKAFIKDRDMATAVYIVAFLWRNARSFRVYSLHTHTYVLCVHSSFCPGQTVP